jgi:GAF domain-containing protein
MNQENQIQETPLVEQLHRLIQAVETSGRVILPRTNVELLQSIVEAAARIFGAGGASIALLDDATQELVFMVANNAGDQSIVGMRIPMNKGIAGYVAMTGQPMAISNVQQDARFNREFAEKTGYIPSSILAMPLVSGDRVIGVMEVLDKLNAASFGIQDMELLAIFAGQAAIAIHQSQQMDRLEEVLLTGLKNLATSDPDHPSGELFSALENQPKVAEDLIGLAEMIKDISAIGERERKTCMQILAVFREYSRSRSDTSSLTSLTDLTGRNSDIYDF